MEVSGGGPRKQCGGTVKKDFVLTTWGGEGGGGGDGAEIQEARRRPFSLRSRKAQIGR